MADYGGVISLSQAHNSDDDSYEHSPRSVPTLSAPGGGGAAGSYSKSKTPSNKIITLDHHLHRLTPFSSTENTARKPRGRPPGSKNKPKQPIVITRDSDSAMKPVVLEISAGSDIIDTISGFARRNHVGVSIITATGIVSDVTLRHPVAHAPALSLHGPFGLLALSGSFIDSSTLSCSSRTIQSSSSKSPSSSSPVSCSFGVTLAGAQGQVFGGIVGGKVTVATQVIVVAATFTNPAFHRLPSEGDNEESRQETKSCIPGNVGGGGGTGGGGGATDSCTSTAMSMSVYGVANPTPLNCHISPDVMP